MEKQRNQSLDVLKGIACIAIVLMHCKFPGIFGEIINAMTRWSVPLFFAVAGYFSYRATLESCLKKVRHIFNITIVVTSIYVVYTGIAQLLAGTLKEYCHAEFTLKNLGVFIFFNRPLIAFGHLWFLYSLLYVYVIYALYLFTFKKMRIYWLIPVLYSVHLFLAYGSYLFGHPLSNTFYRNFLFFGLPSFLLGMWVREKIEKMESARILQYGRVGGFIALGFIALSAVERIVIGRGFDMHICSLVALVGLLYFASADLAGKFSLLNVIGVKYSLTVYVVHWGVFRALDDVYIAVGISDNTVVQWLRPIVAVCISLLIAFAARKIIHITERPRRKAA